MKTDKINYVLCLLLFTLLAFVAFRCAWPADQVLSSSDLNIGRLAYIKLQLPESFIGYFRGTELLGSTSQGVTLFGVLLAALPLTVFADAFYGIGMVAASMFLVWFLRLWNRSWLSSVFGALVAFWFNYTMFAVGGHVGKVEVLTFSVLALVLIEKSIRAERIGRAAGFALLAGLAVGIMMVEQQDVALLTGLFVGPYAVLRLVQVHGKKLLRWVALLAPVGAVALLLAGGTMLKSYEQNITKATTVQDEGEDKWNFITQWSLVPDEWPDLVASGWGGWSSNNPNGPYWGKLGQSAEWPETKQGFRNFKLTSVYVGIIPFLLGAFGLAAAFRNRKAEEGKTMLFWGIAGVLGFWLAFGKYSLLYKLFYHLPLMGNIRAPVKFLDNFLICLGIVSAYGIDRMLVDGKGGKWLKVLWIAGAVCGGLMLLVGLKVLAFPQSWTGEFSQMGFAAYADAMVANMGHAWLHGALLALLLAGLVFAVWKGWKQAGWVAALFVLAVAFDSLALASHYFQSTDIKALKQGNAIVDYIRTHQGDERVYFVDQSGIYNQWLASDGPYHDLNLFNVWQMPRMPADYKEFLGTVGRNPVRLWELSAIRYIAAPASVFQQFSQNPQLAKQFAPVLNYQIPTAQGMRKDVLLEFKGAVPRFALFQGWDSVPAEDQCGILASPEYNPSMKVLVEPSAELGQQRPGAAFQPLSAETTKRIARVRVACDGRAIVRFSQYYQPEWRVFVDGKAAEVLRVDYLCMGVAVPPGEHVVEFRCIDGRRNLAFVLGVFLASVVAGAWLLRPVKKGCA